MRLLIPLIICAIAISMSLFSSAGAVVPTTTIRQLTGTTNAVAGSQTPLSVSATIHYDNSIVGYRLVVGVLDTGLSPQRLVSGVVISSTTPCENQAVASAYCTMTVSSPSGDIIVRFQIGGIFGDRQRPGSWVLNVTSALIDKQNRLVAGSTSSRLFKINLEPVALTIYAPPEVSVMIDGMLQPAGSVSLGVSLGSLNITLPQLVNVSQSTRLRFDHWSDGSLSPFRTITVTGNTSLKADYATQNMLTLINVQGNTTVANWYDANSNATFSTTQHQEASGMFAELAPRLVLQGWYEDGRLVTTSPSGVISMDKPHKLTAVWRTDFSEPWEVVLGILTVVIITILVVERRNRKSLDPSPSKRTRSHSPKTRQSESK